MLPNRFVVGACSLGLFLALDVPCAYAEGAGVGANSAAAEELFREGRALLQAGRVDEACAKLTESQRLDGSAGTLLNLAACHSKQGKIASAWAEFLAAARLAPAQGRPERVQEALARAAELEPKLSYLTLRVQSPAPGLVVQRDDLTLEASSLGSRLPTDPGQHVIHVSAPGREPVALEVTLGPNGDAQTVIVPALRIAKVEPGPLPNRAANAGETAHASPNRDALAPGRRQRTAAFVVGGVGAAALAFGATFGVLALSAYGEADRACPSHADCDPQKKSLADSANLRANLANAGVAVGFVGLGVGAALLLTAPSRPVAARAAGLTPTLGPRGAGLTWTGAF